MMRAKVGRIINLSSVVAEAGNDPPRAELCRVILEFELAHRGARARRGLRAGAHLADQRRAGHRGDERTVVAFGDHVP